MRHGDIYLCDFGSPIGHEQGFQRPAVIISATEFTVTGLAILLPITRTKRDYPTHIELDGVLPIVSYVQCEQIRTISTDRCMRYLARAGEAHMFEIGRVLRRILAL